MSRAIQSEKRVVSKMIKLYCRAHHNSKNEFCEECDELNIYAMIRLDKCPFGEDKPTCSLCPIHCYKKEMRTRVKEVMIFAGPRMLLRHPVDAVSHLARELKLKRKDPMELKNKIKR